MKKETANTLLEIEKKASKDSANGANSEKALSQEIADAFGEYRHQIEWIRSRFGRTSKVFLRNLESSHNG